MNVLVLNRFSFSDAPYHELVPAGVDVVLVTAARALPVDEPVRRAVETRFVDVVAVDDYDDAAAVEVLAHRLHRRYRFDRVVAMSEFDILRAARLRDAWRIPGQTVESAMAFRDKLHMKRHLQAAGVPVARFAPVDDFTDLLRFVEAVGWPVVVKPRRGAGSVGVSVIGDDAALSRWLEEGHLRGDAPAFMLAEEHVPHEMCGVDGVIDGGKVVAACPSRYDATCLDFHHGVGLRSVMLDRDDALAGALCELVERALGALPAPSVALFHAEVFVNAERGLVFNEVASRIGGGGIQGQLRAAYGEDPVAWFVRRELAGADAPLFPSRSRFVAGWALVPPRAGRLVAVPGACPVPGVVECQVRASPGAELNAPVSSVDALALFVARGEDPAAVRRTLERACRWFADGTRIETAVATITTPSAS